jgi:hypothetical protein
MLLGGWAISVTLTCSNQFTMHNFILLLSMEKFGGGTLPTVGRFTKVNCQNYGWCTTQNLLYKSIINNQRLYTLSLMNFIINNLEFFLNTFIYTQY